MTNRERWIVYPLLFFAMSMGFKANYVQPLEFRCQSIECQRLVVQDNLNVPRINGAATLGNPLVRPAQIHLDPAQALNALKKLTESVTDGASDGNTSDAPEVSDEGEPTASAGATSDAQADESPQEQGGGARIESDVPMATESNSSEETPETVSEGGAGEQDPPGDE